MFLYGPNLVIIFFWLVAKKCEKKYPSYDFKSFKIIHHMILENLYRTNLTYSFNTEKLNQMKQTQTKHNKVLTY